MSAARRTAGRGAGRAAKGAARPRPSRAAILAAAAAAVAERGFHGMSMRELAQAVGTSLSNLYNYFASKEEILAALQREAFETLIGSADEALAGVEGAAERLHLFVFHHVRYVVGHQDVMRVLVHEAASLPAAERADVRRLKERYFRLGRGVVAELSPLPGRQSTSPLPGRQAATGGCEAAAVPLGAALPLDDAELDRVTYNLFGMLNWIWGWYRPEQHGGPAELARTIHRILLCGVVTHCPFQDLQESMEGRLEERAMAPLVGAPEGVR
ncbi:MAG TPA: TetR family transcriptional regulator [Thermoanaerobaculia bacterium]